MTAIKYNAFSPQGDIKNSVLPAARQAGPISLDEAIEQHERAEATLAAFDDVAIASEDKQYKGLFKAESSARLAVAMAPCATVQHLAKKLRYLMHSEAKSAVCNDMEIDDDFGAVLIAVSEFLRHLNPSDTLKH